MVCTEKKDQRSGTFELGLEPASSASMYSPLASRQMQVTNLDNIKPRKNSISNVSFTFEIFANSWQERQTTNNNDEEQQLQQQGQIVFPV